MKSKTRGNGQGCAIKVATNNWKAIATIGYTPDGKALKRTKQGFKSKTDALAYIPILKKEQKNNTDMTLYTAYENWKASYEQNVSKSTMYCYIGGFKVFEDYWNFKLNNLVIDDLQDCIDSCELGYRTKQNAKTVLGLIYKWAIPRDCAQRNLSEYLKVRTVEKNEKHGFTNEQLKIIANSVANIQYADMIYCHCLTGFRPTEFLMLKVKDYHKASQCLVGGIKTEAGKNRLVTISPKIKPIVDSLCRDKKDYEQLFSYQGNLSYRAYKEHFYKALAEMGIQSEDDHTLSPHSCRHTFATLIKNVSGSDKDKMRLIGHSSAEMLRYYQDSHIEDIKKITDSI